MVCCTNSDVGESVSNEITAEEINETDCCGNGCTNCILDNKPKQSAKAQLIGKKNIILNYTKFKLLNKQLHNKDLSNVWELHFACSLPKKHIMDYVLDIPPGHHVMMRAPTTNAKYLLRPYSPYWLDASNLEFKILVNLRPQGPMSQVIANMHADDEMEFRGPIGNYEHDASGKRNIYVIVQGVAIAPTIPIIEEVLHNEEDMNRIQHLVCCTDFSHIYFRDRLKEFGNYWNYRSLVYLAHEQCGRAECTEAGGCNTDCPQFRRSLRYKEAVIPRRLDVEQLKLIYEKIPPAASSNFIICGSASFQQYITKIIHNSGIDLTQSNLFLL